MIYEVTFYSRTYKICVFNQDEEETHDFIKSSIIIRYRQVIDGLACKLVLAHKHLSVMKNW